MKKFNKLSRAEMKSVTGGGPPICNIGIDCFIINYDYPTELGWEGYCDEQGGQSDSCGCYSGDLYQDDYLCSQQM